jgi:hypothetical protein
LFKTKPVLDLAYGDGALFQLRADSEEN